MANHLPNCQGRRYEVRLCGLRRKACQRGANTRHGVYSACRREAHKRPIGHRHQTHLIVVGHGVLCEAGADVHIVAELTQPVDARTAGAAGVYHQHHGQVLIFPHHSRHQRKRCAPSPSVDGGACIAGLVVAQVIQLVPGAGKRTPTSTHRHIADSRAAPAERIRQPPLLAHRCVAACATRRGPAGPRTRSGKRWPKAPCPTAPAARPPRGATLVGQGAPHGAPSMPSRNATVVVAQTLS